MIQEKKREKRDLSKGLKSLKKGKNYMGKLLERKTNCRSERKTRD